MRTRRKYTHFGLTVYKLDNDEEWAVGDDTITDSKGRTRVDRAARRAVIDSLWAFNTSFIIDFAVRHNKQLRNITAGTRMELERAVKNMQERLSEDAGVIIKLVIGPHLNAFVAEAIGADGRGHFLSGYDGSEVDSDKVEGLPKGKVAFRIN